GGGAGAAAGAGGGGDRRELPEQPDGRETEDEPVDQGGEGDRRPGAKLLGERTGSEGRQHEEHRREPEAEPEQEAPSPRRAVAPSRTTGVADGQTETNRQADRQLKGDDAEEQESLRVALE